MKSDQWEQERSQICQERPRIGSIPSKQTAGSN
jgi:hypothetical protein